MSSKLNPSHRHEVHIWLVSTITLVRWQLRQTWNVFLIAGLGILVAVTLVCTVSLYSNVAMSAGLHDALSASYQNVDINVQSFSTYPNIPVFDTTTQELNQVFQQYLGPYLQPPQFTVEAPNFVLPGGHLTLLGFPIGQVSPHLHMLQGRLPSNLSQYLEIALTEESAVHLHTSLGSVLTIPVSFGSPLSAPVSVPLKIRVVGIFRGVNAKDPFWHGNTFLSFEGVDGRYYTVLTSNEAFFTAITRLGSTSATREQALSNEFILHWYYQLDPVHISINDLNTLINSVNLAQAYVSNNIRAFDQTPYIETMVVQSSETLELYRDRVSVAQISAVSLLLILVGLMLFSVSILADLLIVRQASTIALLRSRGASSLQIFGMFLGQSAGLALLAAIIGPLLAIVLVYALVQNTLASAGRQALHLVISNGGQFFAIVINYALLTALVAICIQSFSIYCAGKKDLLTYRRETTRTTAHPIWQRLYLDIIGIILALLGILFVAYLTNGKVLNAHLRLLLLTPFMLFICLCLLLAGMLLFLRLLPPLLQISEQAAARSCGSAPLLALAQVARTPQSSLRQALLLALTTAFAIFTLVFAASQTQRANDVAAYQVGTDFQGTLIDTSVAASQINAETAFYHQLPGVTSVTVGYTGSAITKDNFSINMQAVNAATFAQTALWPKHDPPLATLMRILSVQRMVAIKRNVVPAVVNEAAAAQLHLQLGMPFTLTLSSSDNTVNFIDAAEVPLLPPLSQPGILVDYPSFAAIYANDFRYISGDIVPITTIWLRTKNDPALLSSIRHALPQTLTGISDRRVLAGQLQNEPLNLDLIVVLVLGMILSLLIAFTVNLFSAWMIIKERLRVMVVLRALGAASHHIVSIFLWEQCFVYVVALLLGFLFGLLFSSQAVPSMIFTSVLSGGTSSSLSSQDFYLLQNTPPVQLIFPPTISIVVAVFIALGFMTLGLMAALISRSSFSETLRLNED